MIVMGLTGKPMTACGSFGNISIDGRLGILSAASVAREIFQKEAAYLNSEYMGFAIEKTSRFVEYKSPSIFDSELKPREIDFLVS
jgi:hypothetical protein